MSLKDKIQAEASKRKSENEDRLLAENKRFEEKVSKLTPMFNELKESLSEHGFTVILHTDKKHLPCPAIHIESNAMSFHSTAYDMISELFLIGPNTWKAGSCNRHIYTLNGDDELMDHVAKAVSYVISS